MMQSAKKPKVSRRRRKPLKLERLRRFAEILKQVILESKQKTQSMIVIPKELQN